MEGVAGQAEDSVGDACDMDRRLSLGIRLRTVIFQVLNNIGLVFARGLGGRWFGRAGFVVVLIAGDGQDPSSHGFTMNSLCLPWAIRLLGCRLVLCRHASVGPAASIAYQIASNNVVPWDVGTAHLAAMRSRLDDLVAILLHAVTEFLEEIFIAVEDARMGHRHGLQNAEHDEFDNAINAFGAQRCVDLGVDRCQA